MTFHIHRDPNWVRRGANAYYECRCGRRRVREVLINVASPVDPGWPALYNRHGMPVIDTGWVDVEGDGDD